MGAKRNHRQLRKALEREQTVKLTRSTPDAEALEGFVVGLGQEWVLLNDFYNLRLQGWTAVRLDTVDEVERGAYDDVARRFLWASGLRTSGLDEVDLSSTRSIIESMAEALPLVAFLREVMYPNESVIGRPVRFTKKYVDLINVDTGGSWDLDPHYRLKLTDITRLEGGSDYENGLYLLAGEPPPVKTGKKSPGVVRAS